MRKILILLALGAVLVGCGGEGEPVASNGLAEATVTATAMATAASPATATPDVAIGSGGVPATAEPTPIPLPTEEPTATAVPPTPTAEPTPEPEGNDPCLVGTWRVANFDDYLLAAFNEGMATAGTQVDVTVQSSGDLLLSFDGERMAMRDEGFAVTVSLMGQTVATNIDAVGEATYTAENGQLLGHTESLNVAETSQGIAFNFGSMAGEPVTYGCTADTLSWSLESLPIPIQLVRVN
ncbi:MAG: hypothetical protein IPL28_01345 [Chloroflexi bacterium]|nr:hypothetical protein [Chloroflexota bacterium]